jgi:hypothetical protein
MQYEDFVRLYETRSDDDLLRLKVDSENLTQDASSALTSELAKRKIDSAERLNTFRDEERRRKEQDERNPGSLFLSLRLGIGRWHFGKADIVRDLNTGIERFRTTVFILVLWFPLIPTGTYLIQKKRGFFAGKVTILKKLPLDWPQVLKVWVVAAASLLTVIWILTRSY